MCEINPEHTKNVVYEKGRKVLYMKIIRGLYGCIEAALQWYKCYTEVLEKEGFILNPYDKCVATKMIDGHQCTIAWYVDDNVTFLEWALNYIERRKRLKLEWLISCKRLLIYINLNMADERLDIRVQLDIIYLK